MTDANPAAPETPATPPTDQPNTATPAAQEIAAPPAAAPEPKTGSTILDGDEDTGTPPAGGWGDDWRQKYAGDDEKLLKRLERYASPKAALDALFEAQKKISAGEFKKPLPENATEDQVKAWRKENGLPESGAGYFDKLPDGLVLGEADKEIFSSLADRMLEKNVDPAVMHELVGWYNEFSEQQVEAISAREQESLAETQERLREEWGADYRANLNMVKSLLASAPEGIKSELETARLPDGRPLLNSPSVMNWLVQQAREINPAATLVPSGSGSPMQGVEDEIATIEKSMRENRSAYMADDKLQARYRDLLDARAKLAARAA